MRVSITGFYTIPEYYFSLSENLLNLISEKIQTQIINEEFCKTFKFNELELYIQTDGISNTVRTVKKNKSNRGKYLTFALWLPYPEIVKNNKTDLNKFVHYFFEALITVFEPGKISAAKIQTVKDLVINQISGNHEYEYQPTVKMQKWNEVLENYRKSNIKQ